MVKIPDPRQRTAAAIFERRRRDGDDDWRRPHLGASIVGKPCSRQLWYEFRWAMEPPLDGRLLRLFERGDREERWIVEELVALGCEVSTTDPDTEEQWRASFLGGHFGGSCDGKVTGILEAPKTTHVLEVKTSNDRWFKDLQTKGVAVAKPEHYAQVQVYMHGLRLKRTFYICVNKNDDHLYTERVQYDRRAALLLLSKAEGVVFSPEPLTRISEDPAWFECKMCDQRPVCHLQQVEFLARNCRTCASSTPRPDGTWLCELHDCPLDLDDQRAGCDEHLFIPSLLPWEAIDHEGRSVLYQRPDGSCVRDLERELVAL